MLLMLPSRSTNAPLPVASSTVTAQATATVKTSTTPPKTTQLGFLMGHPFLVVCAAMIVGHVETVRTLAHIVRAHNPPPHRAQMRLVLLAVDDLAQPITGNLRTNAESSDQCVMPTASGRHQAALCAASLSIRGRRQHQDVYNCRSHSDALTVTAR